MDCYIISIGPGGYDTFANLLTDTDEGQIVLMTNAISSTGTRSSKQYLNQYGTINPDNHQVSPSKDPITSASAHESPSDKSKSKKIRFDKFLRKWATKDFDPIQI